MGVSSFFFRSNMCVPCTFSPVNQATYLLNHIKHIVDSIVSKMFWDSNDSRPGFDQETNLLKTARAQGDVPRQLGWKAADHWGKVP